ncbi:LysE family transporter [Nocardioides sp. GY 10127]|uniref:LysE family transporter n=1 Tax=Nocardioides sp. GY 10127 TaxID=2569762 RepID=UPI00197DC871|nr:LysE family transporter [Nocardioides sp. GY 10127]
MWTVVVAGLVTGWAIALPVGAIGVLLVSLGARDGWPTASAAALGVATVDGAFAAVAVLAGAAAAAVLEPIAGPLRVAAAGVLLVVAVLVGRSALRPAPSPAPDDPTGAPAASPGLTPLRAYLLLLGLTAVNPTTVVYFVAVVLGNDAVVAGPAESCVFVLAAFAASASWQLVLAGSGAALGRAASSDRARRVTGLVSAVVVALLAVHTLLG